MAWCQSCRPISGGIPIGRAQRCVVAIGFDMSAAIRIAWNEPAGARHRGP